MITVLGPIPLNCESSALISSTDKSRKYSKHNLPFFSSKQLNIFLMQDALVGAKPPHLIAFSIHLDSAERTLNKHMSIIQNHSKSCSRNNHIHLGISSRPIPLKTLVHKHSTIIPKGNKNFTLIYYGP
jgi:hypothetical protein